jgi:hypothetical protein
MSFILQFRKVSQVFHIKGSLLALTLLCAACGGSNSTTATAPTAPVAGPGTQTLNAIMAPGGVALRTFDASASGTVTVTLTSTSPPSMLLGLGIGIPATTGLCNMTTSVNTRAGTTPQITAAVDAGTFCAGAFDPGTVPSGGVLVSITVVHP